ncbi:NHL repeat-containing protein [Maridesulfovibrio bastinii]|uniref:NHL repeat-containing protein n=1 Tax=Maridesulfovibrio bastinii TaxID=47157 RepID=UPI0004241E07|nr:NHL repeat-containing protein [Maridesulfovibrio bastinii]
MTKQIYIIFLSFYLSLALFSSIVFASQGTMIKTIPLDEYVTGFDIDFDGYIHIATTSGIKKYSKDGKYIKTYGNIDYANFPTGIRIGINGNIYAPYLNNEISIFNPEGEYIASITKFGADNNKFKNIVDLAFDNSGDIYVADNALHQIVKLNSNGQYLNKIGGPEHTTSYLSAAQSVVVDKQGIVYVTDISADNSGIKIFAPEGIFIKRIRYFQHAEPILLNGSLKNWSCDFNSISLLNESYILGCESNDNIVHILPTSALTTDNFIYVGRIGNNNENDKNLLDSPRIVRSDKDNKIYILTQQGLQIFKWSGFPNTSSPKNLTSIFSILL